VFFRHVDVVGPEMQDCRSLIWAWNHKGAISDSTACICNLSNCKRAYESVDWLLVNSRMVAIDRDQCETLRKLLCPSGVVDGSNDKPPKEREWQ
jgi:hypothetical protein